MLGSSLAALVATVVAPASEDRPFSINKGPHTADERSLEQRAAFETRGAETYFLLGAIAMQQRDYRRAIACFRRALVYDPRSARLRLEFGRAFYFAKDYSNAELQFQRALAGNLPAPVQANAQRFLDKIRREKRWSYQFNVAVAPDSNINMGSSAKETLIFGLPFELGSDAKMHGGVGLMAEGSAEFAPRLSNRLQWRTGVGLHRSQYEQAEFVDTIAAVWSGPRWASREVEVSATATALRRWYAGKLHQRAEGVRVQAIFYRGSHTVLMLGTDWQRFHYGTTPQQSGPVWSVNAGIVRVTDPTTSVALLINAARQRAHTQDLSNHSAAASFSATHDFRGGFTVTLTPTYAMAVYEAPDVFFGRKRRDQSAEFQARVLNRRAAIWRFTPTLTYTGVRRRSSISIFNSRQDRVELGLTSAF